jgi:hypothetical protein
MAFASVDDVNRVLGFTTGDDPARDAQLRAKLSAVESWAVQQGWALSQRGAQVESYYDVVEDATLHLPVQDCVITKVTVFSSPFVESARDLILGTASPGYEILDEGTIALRPSLWIEPFDGAWASRFIRTHSRVDIHYIGTGIVPPAVTEGIAWLTAAYHVQGGAGSALLQGITSEKIGDYSYTLGSKTSSGSSSSAGPNYAQEAMFWLKPFMRTSHVMVT